ncbi:MAG: hypothetical protein AAF449_12030 [Myxococcota bacterium]
MLFDVAISLLAVASSPASAAMSIERSADAISLVPEAVMCATTEAEPPPPPEPPVAWCSVFDAQTDPRCAPAVPTGSPSKPSASLKSRTALHSLDLSIAEPKVARCPCSGGRRLGPADRAIQPPVPPPRSS